MRDKRWLLALCCALALAGLWLPRASAEPALTPENFRYAYNETAKYMGENQGFFAEDITMCANAPYYDEQVAGRFIYCSADQHTLFRFDCDAGGQVRSLEVFFDMTPDCRPNNQPAWVAITALGLHWMEEGKLSEAYTWYNDSLGQDQLNASAVIDGFVLEAYEIPRVAGILRIAVAQ